MEKCDVLVVGGGPGGSACAWKLRAAGLDVIVVDQAAFPRDKICAGWITPQVIADLSLDVDEYAQGRTWQPIAGFRTGLIGGRRFVETVYGRPVSYGIRRCEFDDYLLRRSGARLRLGEPVRALRREGKRWVVNDAIEAAMLVGAGGHGCPVARALQPPAAARVEAPRVAAREVECAIEPSEAGAYATDPEVPELYFSPGLQGYGWCFRKQRHLNIGFGSLEHRALPKATDGFVAFLESRGVIPRRTWSWRGHAYLVQPSPRRLIGDGVLLVGDAAGLAYAESGEGIRPAIESGLLAASAIAGAGGRYTRARLAPYAAHVGSRFRPGRVPRPLAGMLPGALTARLGRALLAHPRFVRHVVLDRWFLHASEPPLARDRAGGASFASS